MTTEGTRHYSGGEFSLPISRNSGRNGVFIFTRQSCYRGEMYFRGESSKDPFPSVAIVGAALRFPGAADPAAFHELVVAGRRMFRDVPQLAAHREAAHAYGAAAPAPPAAYPLRAALLDHPSAGTTLTDAAATGLADEGAAAASANGPGAHPHLASGPGRYLLAAETAAAALADVPAAGRPSLPGRTGAIVANVPQRGVPDITGWVGDRLGLARQDWVPRYSCSLRAVAAACELLSAGQLDLVIAGGVSAGVDPAWLAYRIHSGALADDDVRVYDVSPTGTLPGEGCGMVALVRTQDARAAGLPVYAEIAGWQAAGEMTAPSTAIRGAYTRSGLDPGDVQYVEGHGAATAVDDLAELSALLDVLAAAHDGTPGGCALGSVAANIGDTRGAAGVAALLKTALAMTAGVVPPTTGCVRPHQLLRTGAAPFRLPASPEPWPETATRLAAVNSLGTADFAGGFRSGPVHLILRRDTQPGPPPGHKRRAAEILREAARRSAGARRAGPAETPQHADGPGPGAHARPPVTPPRPRVPLDSAGPGALSTTSATAAGPSETRLAADTLAGEWVIAVRGADREDLAVTLDTIAMTAARLHSTELRKFALEMATAPTTADLRARAAIVARDPAQLAQRARKAAASLREKPAGPHAAGAGGYVSEGATGRIALLFPGLVSTAVEHSAVLSASMATLDAADRLGLRPQLAVGHSFGEITGLAWAGVLTFGEAARLAAHRAEIIRGTPGHAAMARVHASPGTVAGLCSGTGLTIAVHEAPVRHVVAGPVSAIRELPQRAALCGVDTEVLSITHALHSPAMRRSTAPMRAVVNGLRFAAPQRRLVSTVTGLDITGAADPAGLVAEQLARPALLAGALALACADADLILLTARDPALAQTAIDCDRALVVQAPLDLRPGMVRPSAVAAFFAAGAIDSILPFLPAAAGQSGDAGGGGTIRSAISGAEKDADPHPDGNPGQPGTGSGRTAGDQGSAEGPGGGGGGGAGPGQDADELARA